MVYETGYGHGYDNGYLDALEDAMKSRILNPKKLAGPKKVNIGCERCVKNWRGGFKAHGRHRNTRIKHLFYDYLEKIKLGG